MWVYLIGTALYMGFTYLLYFIKNHKDKFKNKKLYYLSYVVAFILSILPLTLISGLRYKVGTDYTHTYAPHFIEQNWDYSEKVFIWINMFLRLFTDDPVILFLFMATVTQVFIQLAITKVSPNWWLSAGLFVFCNHFAVSLNQSRQIMAVCILAYAATFIHEKKLIPYLIWVLVATSMHYSSIIFLPIYFICRIKGLKKWLPVVVLALFAFMPLFSLIATKIVMMTKYSYYLTDSHYMTNQTIKAYFFAALMTEGTALVWYDKMVKKFDTLATVMVFINGIALCIGFLGYFIRVPELMARTYLIFSISQIILIPLIIYSEDDLFGRILLLVILVASVTGSSCWVIFKQKHHEIFPYQWIFNKTE